MRDLALSFRFASGLSSVFLCQRVLTTGAREHGKITVFPNIKLSFETPRCPCDPRGPRGEYAVKLWLIALPREIAARKFAARVPTAGSPSQGKGRFS